MRFIKKVIKKIKQPIRSLHKYWKYKVLYSRTYKKYAKQPVDEKKVVFVEMRYPNLSDSFHLLYDNIKQNYDMMMNVHFLQVRTIDRKEQFKRCQALMQDIATAKYIFLSDGSSVLAAIPMRPETKVIQLWHACGAFKKFGRSTATLGFGGNAKEHEKYPGHKNYTLVPVSSKEVVWAYEEAMGLDKEIAKPLGVSRTDIFYDQTFIQSAKDKLSELIPQSEGKKVILYAPTYRGGLNKPMAPDQLDIKLFRKCLSDKYILLLKQHPLVKIAQEIPVGCDEFAFDITNEFKIEEAICVADICISDYSSVIYEYSLFEKPIIFFSYDLDEYDDWRGFYYDYQELTPGPVCKDNESMLNYIEQIDTKFKKEEIANFRKKFMGGCDGQATKRILESVFDDTLDKYKRAKPLTKADYLFPVAADWEKKKSLYATVKIQIKRQINKIKNRAYKDITLKWTYPRIYNKHKKQPIDEKKIIFIEVRLAELRNGFHILYDQIIRNYDVTIHTHFLQHSLIDKKEMLKRGKDLAKDLATAKYVFIAEATNILGSLKLREETHVTQLWHGCGAFKRFGFSTGDFIFGDSLKEQKRFPSHKNYSTVTVSSPEVVWAYEEAMDISAESGIVKPLGVSRTDVFYDKDFIKKASTKLQKRIPASIGKKVILYAPTFRGRVVSATTPDEFDLELLQEKLGDEYILLQKHHPIVKHLPNIPLQYRTFTRDVTNDFSIEELICVADICISDYSSLIFEYSLFERPMIFFAYDLDEFNDWRGFYYDYDEMTPGPIYTSTEEIIEYIQNVKERFDQNEMHDFREKFMRSCDGQATKRIMTDAFGSNLEKFKRKKALSENDYEFPKVKE